MKEKGVIWCVELQLDSAGVVFEPTFHNEYAPDAHKLGGFLVDNFIRVRESQRPDDLEHDLERLLKGDCTLLFDSGAKSCT